MPLDVFAEDVGFEVDGVAGEAIANVGVIVGVRNDGDFGDRILPTGDYEADAVDGDGALADKVGCETSGDVDSEEPTIASLLEMSDVADGIDVAQDKVSAEFFPSLERLFEIYAHAGLE